MIYYDALHCDTCLTSATLTTLQGWGLGALKQWMQPASAQHEHVITETSLKHEISSLEEFNRELFLEMSELKMEQDRIKFSRTILGKFYNFLGYFFSGYCLYKLFMVSVRRLLLVPYLPELGNDQHRVRSHHQARSSHARTAHRTRPVPRGH